MQSRDEPLGQKLDRLRRFTPTTRGAATALAPLDGERLLVVCHLDAKMVPYFEALLADGAEVWACAVNLATTRDVVARCLNASGVRAPARLADPRNSTPQVPPRADALFTTTDRDYSVPFEASLLCKSGTFLADLCHTSGEPPVGELQDFAVARERPYVERCEVEGRTPYLLARGAMFNLAAGLGTPTTPSTS